MINGVVTGNVINRNRQITTLYASMFNVSGNMFNLNQHGMIATALRPMVPNLTLRGICDTDDWRAEGLRQQRAVQARASALSWHASL